MRGEDWCECRLRKSPYKGKGCASRCAGEGTPGRGGRARQRKSYTYLPRRLLGSWRLAGTEHEAHHALAGCRDRRRRAIARAAYGTLIGLRRGQVRSLRSSSTATVRRSALPRSVESSAIPKRKLASVRSNPSRSAASSTSTRTSLSLTVVVMLDLRLPRLLQDSGNRLTLQRAAWAGWSARARGTQPSRRSILTYPFTAVSSQRAKPPGTL